jgi:signal transduction histidine kinase
MGTPLNVIDARAEMIEQAETDDVSACARVVRDQVKRITRIVRQLLDFARKRPLELEPCDFGATARGVAELLSSMARKRQVDIHVTAPEAGPIALAATGQIEQVLTNIVVNAVQASPEGGRVDVEVQRATATPPGPEGLSRECIVLRVSDQGPGIPPEAEPHIFDPFFTTKDVGLGTGLGLSVSYGIVDEYGGWIEASTREVGGASFTIYIPCNKEDGAHAS